MNKAKTKAGRPFLLSDHDAVYLQTPAAKSQLQELSDRRAICNKVLDLRGKATIAQLNEHFGYDVRSIVLALIKAGYLAAETKSAA